MIYVRSAFAAELPGSVFAALEPPLTLPFSLAWRAASRTRALAAVLRVARAAVPI